MSKRTIPLAAAILAAFVFGAPLPLGAQNSATPNLHHDHHAHPHNSPHATTEPPTKERFFTTRSSDVVLPLPGEEEAFVFAVFGDRTGGPPEGVDVLAEAVRDVNLIEPDLVMTVGDLIQGFNRTPEWLAQMREFKEIMSELLCPWFPVAGNHDIYWRPRKDPDMPHGQHEENYEMHFGPLWYSFQHKDSNFIVLYSDEGDPETGEKGPYPAAQKISDKQFAFLKEALSRGKDDDHQFLFLHHPRWLSDRYGNDWRERVHPLLKETGNVTAVFAGHIHRMRYDPEDGIEYVTLASVGANQRGTVPEAGFLHHYHLVTVRPEQVAMAAFPVGEAMNVREITGKLQQETVELAEQEPEISGQVRVTDEGPQPATLEVVLENPTSRPVDFTLTPVSDDSRWVFSPDHDHGRIEAGDSATVEVAMEYVGEQVDEGFRSVELKLAQEYLTDTTRYTIPAVTVPVPMRIELSASSGSLANRALRLDGENDAVRIVPEAAELPQGPFTLEAWFNAERFGRRIAVVTKTQGSEFGIFSFDGSLSGSVHLGGSYRRVRSGATLETDRWYHVAGVYDGQSFALFLDGRELGRIAVDPKWRRKTNELPLFIGADPGRGGEPISHFPGMIDEVRLSRSAIYTERFTPQRRLQRRDDTVLLYQFDFVIGQLAYDSGPRGEHSQMIGGARLSEPLESGTKDAQRAPLSRR